MTGIQKISKLPIYFVRALIEITVVLIGWYLGGVVGLGTIIFALFVGPFVSFGLLIVKIFFK